MAALTLANMLARVKRNVPTTTMDTELGDALLERMNYLASLDSFPFQEGYQTTTLTAGDYRLATPDNFAYAKSIAIWQTDIYRPLEYVDPVTFAEMYPKPDQNSGDISCYTIRVAEGEIWFNSISSSTLTIRILFHKIPDDATDTTVSQMVELAKITLIKWASADGFRMMGEHDRADKFEADGGKTFLALKRRYQLSKEEGARFISLKEKYFRQTGN